MQRTIIHRYSWLILLLAGLVVLTGCSDDTDFVTGNSPADATTPAVASNKDFVEGSFGTGSTYKLLCPGNWNGDLVVYTHGYAFPETEPALPDADDPGFVAFRDALMDMGYGVAYSSYSETGWALKRAIVESRQLRGLFTAQYGMPDKTFLTGVSMGGLISLSLAERNPGLYDGVMPMCGVLGGGDMAVSYITNVRLLFDYYYPGVLPGTAFDVPQDLHWTTAQYLAYMAMLANPMPAFELAGVDQVEVQYNSPEELLEAILWALIFHTASFHDFLDHTHGHDFFDNMNVQYSGSLDDVALNEGVGRNSAARDALMYMKRWYEPTGKLLIPAVAIHTTRDPVVQIFNEHDYLAKVVARGNEDNLTQYEIDRFGHCTFTLEEMLAAFNEMVAKAEVTEPMKIRPGK